MFIFCIINLFVYKLNTFVMKFKAVWSTHRSFPHHIYSMFINFYLHLALSSTIIMKRGSLFIPFLILFMPCFTLFVSFFALFIPSVIPYLTLFIQFLTLFIPSLILFILSLTLFVTSFIGLKYCQISLV